MFVGYAKDHDRDAYEMWDLKTGREHISWDVVWLRRMFVLDPEKDGGDMLIKPLFMMEKPKNDALLESQKQHVIFVNIVEEESVKKMPEKS